MLVLTVTAIFTTSCEREAILPDSISILEENGISEKKIEQNPYVNSLKTCIPQAPSEDYIDYILRDFLIPNTESFLNTPNSVRAGDVQNRYGTIVRYLNSKLCTTLDDTPVWHDGLPQLVLVLEVKGCTDDVTRALFSLQYRLEQYLMGNNTPTCQQRAQVKSAFINYISELNDCFNASFNILEYNVMLSFLDC